MADTTQRTGTRSDARMSRRQLMQTALGAGASVAAGSLLARDIALAQGGDTPPTGGQLFYGSTSRWDTLDPNITTFTDVARIGFHLFDPLVWEAKGGEFIPGLAEKWEVNATADRYTFYLRKDVKFHDGTPFTADAVKFTFDGLVDREWMQQMAF